MGKKLISVENLSFSYKNHKVLRKCDFNIYDKSINALIGINGAGKTTLFNCLIKGLTNYDGNIFYNNEEIKKISYKGLAKLVSFVPQLSLLGNIDCPVRDFLVEGRTPYLKPFAIPNKNDYLIVEKYAKEIGVYNLLGSNLMNLSGGQLQLILIARALIQETDIIIMDEPMSALDLTNQAVVLKLIKSLNKKGKTIVFTTHNPNHAIALNCNVLVLADGKILNSGIANEVLTTQTISEIYSDCFEKNENGFIQLKKI